MYLLTYDGQTVHDPRTNERVCIALECDLESSTAGTLTFEIAPTHPLYGRFQAMSAAHEVRLFQDSTELFRGRITSDGEDMETRTKFMCQGQLGYLNDTTVRPYGTYADTSDKPQWSTVVDGTVVGYLTWLVGQHNANSLSSDKRFEVGKCELAKSITRSSTQWPTTGSEIRSKLVDELGCIVHVRSEGDARFVDILAEGGSDAAQRIEFGTNLLDYASTRDASTVITDIIPRGKPKDGDEFGIDAIGDGPVGEGCTKLGDHVYSEDGVRLYGVVSEKRRYDGVDTPDALLSAACADLATSHVVVESLEISAVDLSLVDPSTRPIRLDEWVRVTSAPHHVDQMMVCSKLHVDALDPTQTKLTLGATLPSLTHDSTLRTSRVRLMAEQTIEDVASISAFAKATATKADTAQSTADGKRRVFTAQPVPPYDVGDLWVDEATGATLVCMTAKEA